MTGGFDSDRDRAELVVRGPREGEADRGAAGAFDGLLPAPLQATAATQCAHIMCLRNNNSMIRVL